MGIVSQIAPQRVTLRIGQQLTVQSADPQSAGRVYVYGPLAGSESIGSGSVAANGSQAFGPYDQVTRLLIAPTAGQLTYDIAFVGQSGGASLASSTGAVAIGAQTVTGRVPVVSGYTTQAGFKKNGSTVAALGTVAPDAQGNVSYGPVTLAAADQVSFPWQLTGESPPSTVPTAPAPALAIAGTPGAATVDAPYNFSPTVSGGSGVRSFALAGTLLAGLSFSSTTGAITGTPTTPGTASGLSITVTDSTGSATLGPFSIAVSAASVTLAALTLSSASYTANAAAGTVIGAIQGATSGSALSLANDNGGAVALSGSNLVVGASAPNQAGTFSVTLRETLAGATNSPRDTALTITVNAAAGVPLAPTLAADNGNAQVRLRITDNPSSQSVQKYGIYKAAASGGTPVFQFWAYNPNDVRAYLANASTGYYRASAWNTSGEGPQSAEVAASAASTNTNPLRLLGTTLFVNTLFYEPIGADFTAGSTVSVTSSDGTTLQTKTSAGGAIIVYGTFTSTGAKTITFTESLSAGGTVTSTQVITVVARPSASLPGLKTTAQALKARLNAKPTYTDTPITITDTGTSMPAGYTATHTYFAGRSIPPPASSVAQGPFSPGQNIVAAYDPVERKTSNQYLSRYGGTNTVLRQRLFKPTWVLGLGSDGGTAVGQVKVRYSDDEMATWKAIPDPVFIRWQSGTHYLKIDPGSAPPAGGRIWEVEFANYTYFADNNTTNGFGYEAGETPQAVTDTSPVSAIYVDSFANGVGAMDIAKNMGRRATRQIGLLNFWNMGIPSHRYTNPATSNFPLGLDRMGDNVVGSGDFTMPPRLDIVFLNYTINDNSNTDYVQTQAIFTNVLLRARRLRPNTLIVLTVGFWSPQDRASTSSYNALKAAFADAKDAGMTLNDGVAAGWAVASGATGSSPYFMASASVTVTGQIAGNVLTVSNGSGLEPGMYFWSGGSFNGARIYAQTSGTTGGAGTYQLDTQPLAGDQAAGSSLTFQAENYTAAYPVHPSPAGHLWAGDRIADGAAALINQLVTLSSPLATEGGLAITTESGQSLTSE